MQRKPRKMILPLGTRIKHVSGQEGTIKRYVSAHSGYLVEFDNPHPFSRGPARVLASSLTPTDPKLHEKWESLWPPFVQRDRKPWATLKEDA